MAQTPAGLIGIILLRKTSSEHIRAEKVMPGLEQFVY
jgi:hypothetical protein